MRARTFRIHNLFLPIILIGQGKPSMINYGSKIKDTIHLDMEEVNLFRKVIAKKEVPPRCCGSQRKEWIKNQKAKQE